MNHENIMTVCVSDCVSVFVVKNIKNTLSVIAYPKTERYIRQALSNLWCSIFITTICWVTRKKQKHLYDVIQYNNVQ